MYELEHSSMTRLKRERSQWEKRAAQLGSRSVEQSNEIATLMAQVAALNLVLKERAREYELTLQRERAERKVRDREARRQQRQNFDVGMKADAAKEAAI